MSTTVTASRSNLGPLTTPFTYPSSCTVAIRACETCDLGWQAQTCITGNLNVADNADCWPARTTSMLLGDALGGNGFYSPGIACPVGYATSCVATAGVDGGFQFQFPLLEGETAIGCCPIGFVCSYDPGDGNAQTCQSIITTGSFAAAECSSGNTNHFSYITVPATPTNTASESESESEGAAYFSKFTIRAPLFQLIHSDDIPTTANTDSINNPTSSTAITSSTSTGPLETQSPSNGALSTGAKAGIGVGVSLGIIALVGAAVLYYLHRRRRSTRETPMPAEQPKPELPGGQSQHAVELHAISAINELPANSPPEHG